MKNKIHNWGKSCGLKVTGVVAAKQQCGMKQAPTTLENKVGEPNKITNHKLTDNSKEDKG